MPAKPAPKTIVDTYTLDEIIDVVKLKAQSEIENQMDELKKHIESFSSGVATSEASTPETPTTQKSTRGRRRGGKKSLGDFILETIGSTPMKIDDIMKEIKAKGYKSKSKDPRRVLYLELKKQVENGNLEKTGRGLYNKA